MSETQLSEYCRKQGLYAAQITRGREACERANDWSATENTQLAEQKRGDRDRIRELERDLTRKEKALAEAAALLILQKKSARSGGKRNNDKFPDARRSITTCRPSAQPRLSHWPDRTGLSKLSEQTLRGWREAAEDKRPAAKRSTPINVLKPRGTLSCFEQHTGGSPS